MIIWLISGLWIFLGCAEAAHLIALLTDHSLQTYTTLWLIFSVIGLVGYTGLIVFFRKRVKKITYKKEKQDRTKAILYTVLFVLLAGISIGHFLGGYVPDIQDATYEIALGNINSGTIMTRHPFLGTVLEQTMPMRMQILGLSSLYSALITISKQSPYIIMCKIVPCAVWGLSLLLYWAFAKKLFGRDFGKCILFVSMTALLYLVTSKTDGMVGQRLFYSGFSAETIRAALLIPYTIYVGWEKKWYLSVLAIVMEACLVWTTFGVGYCFLITVCMVFIHMFVDRRVYADRVE